MVSSSSYVQIGYSDYGDIYLKRQWDRIILKRINPLDYEYMDDYIRDNHDIRWEWQDDVYNWHTEQSYDEWLDDYEYPYWDFFTWDSDADAYYDDYSDDSLFDAWYVQGRDRETTIEWILDKFSEYEDWDFNYVDWNNHNRLRELVAQYFDEAVEYIEWQEEQKKPHWNAFSYYK